MKKFFVVKYQTTPTGYSNVVFGANTQEDADLYAQLMKRNEEKASGEYKYAVMEMINELE